MLILVVLSLLVMFALMSMTYVLLASKQLQSAKSFSRTQTNAGSPQGELEAALMQLARGGNPHSPINPHNLLADLNGDPQVRTVDIGGNPITIYGPNSVRGSLRQDATPLVGGQLVDLETGPRVGTNEVDEFSLLEGYYEGCVLTMTSGVARGLSTRIVRYAANDSGMSNDPRDYVGTFRVVAFKGQNGTIVPNPGDTFLVNGRPFSGTGFGFNNETGKLDAMYDPDPATGTQLVMPHALLINPAFYDPGTPPNDYAPQPGYPNGVPFGGIGGANDDYDAADFQNLHLSLIDGTTNQVILPSFHRPDLINYWHRELKTFIETSDPSVTNWNWGHLHDGDGNGDPDGHALLRKIMLRPSPLDHPNFTGSNPYLDINNSGWQQYLTGRDPSTGNPVSPWDVDNDGDGIMDSVWLDLGFPVRTMLDGRKYKPLFAFLVVDLDSRVNVNAHGNAVQPTWPANTMSQRLNWPVLNPSGGSTTQAWMPVGQGFGPADINLRAESNGQPIFDADELTRLLSGFTTPAGHVYLGRYGEQAGGSPLAQAGASLAGPRSRLSILKHFQWPDPDYDPASNPPTILPLSSFGSTPDFWGRGLVGLDYRGQPVYWKKTIPGQSGWAGEIAYSPYDLDLSRNASRVGGSNSYSAADNPYTVFDLESVLRQWDIDSSSLSSRLTAIATSASNVANWRTKITSDSWDLPTPGIVAPNHLRQDLEDLYGKQFASTVVEMLAARIQQENPTWQAPEINAQMRRLLAPEVIAGLRMNINRPLGDGRDSDGNGIVDEPTISELLKLGQTSPTATNVSKWVEAFNTSIRFNLTNGVDINNDGQVNDLDFLLARQLMARHLYVLARLMMDEGYTPTGSTVPWFTEGIGTLPQNDHQRLAIRRVAQWAINVVDFMDPDNICTPFEYDLNPFREDIAGSGHTWEVNGLLDIPNEGNHRGLVWGCEAPALMLTETIAFHDRAMKDSEFDTNQSETIADGDLNADQRRIPQGSLFIELYCPGSTKPQTAYPADLYGYDATAGWFLHLGRMAPAGAGGLQYPVWRLAISKPHTGYGGDTTPSPKTLLDPDNDGNYADGQLDTISLETQQLYGDQNSSMSLLDTNQRFEVERFGWFTNASTLGFPNADRIYSRRNGPEVIAPGQYMVIGPRRHTRIGWTTIASTPATDPYATPANQPSRQKILLNVTNPMVGVYDHQTNGTTSTSVLNYPAIGNVIQPALSMTLAIGSSTQMPQTVLQDWGTDPQNSYDFNVRYPEGIGFNVSEPLISAYYEEPKFQRPAFDGETPAEVWDCYGPLKEMLETNNPNNRRFRDVPEDIGKHLDDVGALQTGTYLNFKTVFLQRLANPLEAFDPVSNPYLTVDWMPIDLTVFNGDDNSGNLNTVAAGRELRFASRQRGSLNSYVAPPGSGGTTENSNSMVWSQVSEDPILTPPPPTGDAELVFGYELKYYNDPANPDANALAGSAQKGLHTLGFLNGSYGYPLTVNDVGAAFPEHIGGPRKPFPWLPWNNRPYYNVAELMLVPATTPGRLLLEFSPITTGQPYNTGNNPQDHRAPFNHLLNFFHSTDGAADKSANLANLLEYLHVPSPFIGTETVLSPQNFEWAGTTAGPEPSGTEGFHPPFNMISNYREPGRVNINTIAGGFNSTTTNYESAVWNAVLGGDPVARPEIPGPFFKNVADSRRGYQVTGNNLYAFDEDYPSVVMNPFRSAAGFEMVPPVSALAPRKPAEVTLLRPDPTAAPTLPLFNFASNQPYNDTDRNSAFKYQTLTRTMSKLTTRSNVYAVWITVGYFEVEPHAHPTLPAGPNFVYPDGYWLGQELGADTGEINRHRAFYIFDRSIPVGYERGQDHNVQDAVLLRRFIE